MNFKYFSSYFISYIKCKIVSFYTNIHFKKHIIIERNIRFITNQTGSINLSDYVVIRNNCEIHADNGEIILEGHNFINRNCTIVSHDSIIIGSGTTIGSNVSIYDHDHDYKEGKGVVSNPIIIGRNVWIGTGAIILRGTIIGDNSIIGAGTLIKGKIPEKSLVINSRELIYKKL